MDKLARKLGIVIRLSVFWFATLFLSGCVPERLWVPTGGRGVFGPSVSPDGKHLAYIAWPAGERGSDIFISLPDGTDERNVTQHPASDWHPVWSLDGQFIYFESDRGGDVEIYRVRNDGAELKNISQNPAIDKLFDLSPDGSKIVFERHNPKTDEVTLIIASADGANQRVLVKGGWWAQWSPDGQWILHSRVADANGAWIIHPDGSGERRIELDKGFGWPLVWTPDSRAFFAIVKGAHCNKNLCSKDVYLLNLDGTERKLVLQDVANDRGDPSVPTNLSNLSELRRDLRDLRCSWDSTGTRLVLAVNTYTRRNGIVILSRYGELLADFRPERAHHDFRNACWGPHDETILFTKIPHVGETTGGIFSIKGDGTGEKQVIPDNVVWTSPF